MTKDEELAMDLALEALEQGIDGQTSIQMDKAITAIKQARSAPYVASPRVQEPVAFNAGVPPLYPEIKDGETISVEYTTPPAAPVQEPVAIVDEDGVIVVCNYKYKPGDKLYTTPPAAQRPWVGLTPHERMMCRSYDIDTAIDKTEAKLRSKNNG